MELNLHPERKIAEIWLTKAEKGDRALQRRLRQTYHEYYAQGYTVAVYLSGEQGLSDLTGQLLCQNRRRLAELEAR